MSTPLSSDLLSRLSDWATAQFGLRFPPDRWSELARGVASAALELGIPDLVGWAEALASGQLHAEHARAVANHLTISETYFFRHPEAFRLMEQTILPQRLAYRQRHHQSLRIWSAACASGEEPYSVAMLLRHRFPQVPPERITIAGTDINSHVLARAEQGVYSNWSFRDTPDWVQGLFFQRRSNGRFEISPEIRQSVRFSQLNLAAPFYPAEFGERANYDLILCRNVLMYFSAEWQQRITRRITQALAPDGWLLVGPCDIAAENATALGLSVVAPGVFKKVASGDEASSALDSLNPRDPHTLTDSLLPSLATRPALLDDLVAPALTSISPEPAEVTTAATEAEVASIRAQSHADRGELDEARTACEEAIANDKTNAGYHYLHGCILQEQNRLAEAADAYRRVLYLEPHAVMAQFALGCLATRQKRPEEARRHFASVLRILNQRNLGEPIAGSDGLTVGRLRAVIESNLASDTA